MKNRWWQDDAAYTTGPGEKALGVRFNDDAVHFSHQNPQSKNQMIRLAAAGLARLTVGVRYQKICPSCGRSELMRSTLRNSCCSIQCHVEAQTPISVVRISNSIGIKIRFASLWTFKTDSISDLKCCSVEEVEHLLGKKKRRRIIT